MKTVSERVGGIVLVSVSDCRREVTFPLDLATATKLGTALLALACRDDDGLELPEDLRLKEREA